MTLLVIGPRLGYHSTTFQESFWRGVMEAPSAPDQRVPKVVVPPIEQLLNPASVDEVRRTLEGGHESSPGGDEITLRDWKRAHPDGLISHFNLWLLTSTPPSDFKSGVTTLIPKSADSKTPGEYRPITICAMVARVYHRMLASRLERELLLLLTG